MGNSWSFLYDELNMDEQRDTSQDFWESDGISLIGNPGSASSDTINFGTRLPGGLGDDHISFSPDTGCITFGAAEPVSSDYLSLVGNDTISFDLTMDEKNNKYKYSEDVILKELQEYITGTYNQHYSAGDDKIQTLDLIEACGDGEPFCRSNILKYASRYDKKGTARRDIMKILHYAVLLMHFNDKNAQRETYPQ